MALPATPPRLRPLLFALPALLAAWCQVARATTPASSAPVTEIVVASIHADLLPGLRLVAPDFERETGIRVRAQGMPYAAHEMWIRTRFISGTPPDVLLIEGTGLSWRYGQAGLLIDIGQAAEADRVAAASADWLAAIRPELVQQSRDPAGRLWSVPFTQYGLGFFYNQNLYARAGIQAPDTWNAFAANLDALRSAGLTAQAVALKPNDAQSTWMADMLLELLLRPATTQVHLRAPAGWRYDPLDPVTTEREVVSLEERIVGFKRGLLDPRTAPAFAETARLIAEVADNWRDDFLSLDGEEPPRLFARGDAATFLNGTWYLRGLRVMHRAMGEIEPDAVFPWGVFLFPRLTAESTALPLLGGINQNAGLRTCFALPRQPGKPEREAAALAFMRFLARVEVADKLFAGTDVYDLPALTRAKPKPEVAPLLPKERFAYLPLAQFRGYDAESESEFWTLWQRYLSKRSDLREFLDGLGASHERALHRVARAYGAELDRAFLARELGAEFVP